MYPISVLDVYTNVGYILNGNLLCFSMRGQTLENLIGGNVEDAEVIHTLLLNKLCQIEPSSGFVQISVTSSLLE